ncbi:mug86 [Candida metapsilosis]|uniref:Mug86 n=1 Tax=Candida metapsilosis TaxID=273372 RepID=A0A8H8DDT3_9ASCO|nr:mug86 [Candida metapsilosis]
MSSTSSQQSGKEGPTTNRNDQDVSRVHVHGQGGEFVTINGQKFYRHELMSAFGGTLNPGLSPYPQSKINSAPVGLSGFALTTFILSLCNARAMGITIPNIVVSLACMYGGTVQFLAGLLEFVAGNTFGFTALTSYGAFWISYAAIFIEAFGISEAYKEDEASMENAIGFFLIGWAIFTFILVLNTLKSTLAFFSLFFFLLLTFLLLAGGAFTGRVGATRAGGVFGVITAIIAWYNAFAGTATRANSYIIAHPVQLPVYKRD